MIEDLGNPLRDKPVAKPIIYSAQNSTADDEIGPRPNEPPRGDGQVPPMRTHQQIRDTFGMQPSRSFNMMIPQEHEDEYHAAEAKALYAVESDCDY